VISLKISNIYFSFDKPVLQSINIVFANGLFTGILGPNGAGKSTLVKILSRWYLPDKGDIFVGDKSLSALTQQEIARRIAIVEQEQIYGSDITVLEMVALGRLPHQSLFGEDSDEDKSNVYTAMERAGVLGLAKRRLSTLSGGEKQRVRIATALAQNTPVIILDEPTSHLDIKYQMEILNLLRTLARDGLTVIAILHDINLAALFCDRLAILAKGKIIAEGSPEEVLTSQAISFAYECKVDVVRHPREKVPQIALLRG
jgi:iron complex transport system ATP-binding protein